MTMLAALVRRCSGMRLQGARAGVGDVDALDDESVSRRRFTRKKAARLDGQVDVVVIGGGIGGMTTASAQPPGLPRRC